MEIITSFLRDNNLSSHLFILSSIAFLFFIVRQTRLFGSKHIKNLPPGPLRLPVIGNLHQIGDNPHVSTAKFAKEYGPLISVKLGKKVLVVASSPEAAKAILKTQDRLLSSRTVPTAFQQPSLLPHSLIWSECNQTWKTLRTLTRVEIFSAKALEAQSTLRERKIDELLDFLRKQQGQVINIEDVVSTTLFNTLSNIIFARDFLDLNNKLGTLDGLKEAVYKVIAYGSRIKDLGSFYPGLESFDLHGIRKGTMKQFDKIFSYWDHITEERRAVVNSPTWSSDQTQHFVDHLLENGFSNNQINQVITVRASFSTTLSSKMDFFVE